jgi:hypothetical protein
MGAGFFFFWKFMRESEANGVFSVGRMEKGDEGDKQHRGALSPHPTSYNPSLCRQSFPWGIIFFTIHRAEARGARRTGLIFMIGIFIVHLQYMHAGWVKFRALRQLGWKENQNPNKKRKTNPLKGSWWIFAFMIEVVKVK